MLTALALLTSTTGTAQAATITVTSLADSGPGSLRAAIAAAAPNDTIDFAVTGTITLTSAPLLIDKHLTISGPGAASLTVDGNTVIAAFRIQNGLVNMNVFITGLTITNGAGVCIESGIGNDQNLHVADCVFTNCAGAGFGGAIHSDRYLVVENTTFTNNVSGWGGAILGTGSVSISGSTFTGNDASLFGAAVWAGGGTLTILDSTFTGNETSDTSFGVVNMSGGTGTIVGCTFTGNGGGAWATIESSQGSMAIANCTFSGEDAVSINNGGLMTVTNTTVEGGDGIAIRNGGTLFVTDSTLTGNWGGIDNEGDATITNCTIADNSAPFEPWAGVRAGGVDATTRVRNTIVANNSPANCLASNSAITSQGYNLDSGTNCAFTTTGDLSSANPMLAALADNGGATFTRATIPGSPAIDAGNPATPGSGGTACDPGDQRGVPRVYGACDIGAYETSACGNGMLDPGEGCDDGNIDPDDGCTGACTICGDGIVDGPDEQCDDNNILPGDGCRPDCRLELDPFMCYKIKTTSGTAQFVPQTVNLVDQFGTTNPLAKKRAVFCNPASKFDEDPYAPTHPDHLEAYRLKREPGTPAFVDILDVPITTQFGPELIDIKEPSTLRVPTAKSLTSSPTAPNPIIDHFQCYKVKASETPAVRKFGVRIQDQFGVQVLDLVKPIGLCVPVNKNNEAPGAENNPGSHLCYATKRAKNTPKFTQRVGIFTHNQFGTERIDAKSTYVFCVPALLNPVSDPTPSTTPTPTETPTPTVTVTPRFIDNGNGTISDNQTGLMWEDKTGTATGLVNCTSNPGTLCPDPHEVDNAYQWCAGTFPNCTNPANPPDGQAFTVFVASLNSAVFGGFSDWRLPTNAELQTLVDLTAPGRGSGSACIFPIFQPVATVPTYRSSEDFPGNNAAENCFSYVSLGSGCTKSNVGPVRAVRP